jgi:invasion protein IalB
VKSIVSALALATAFGWLPSPTAVAQAPKPAPRAAEPAPALPAATPAATPPPVKIHRTEIVVNDNWTVTCTETEPPNPKRRCKGELKIIQTDSNPQRVVFTWVIVLDEGKPVSVLAMGTGLQIPPGVEIRIGDRELKRAGFSVCQPDHCEAIVPMDDALVKDLSAAQTSDVIVTAANGNPVKFTANMKGFDQAYAAVTK